MRRAARALVVVVGTAINPLDNAGRLGSPAHSGVKPRALLGRNRLD